MLDHRRQGEDRKGQEQAGPEPLPEIGHHMAVIVPGMTPVAIMTGMVRGRRRAVITMGGMIVAAMFVSVVMLVRGRNRLVQRVFAVVDVLAWCPVHGPKPNRF